MVKGAKYYILALVTVQFLNSHDFIQVLLRPSSSHLSQYKLMGCILRCRVYGVHVSCGLGILCLHPQSLGSTRSTGAV